LTLKDIDPSQASPHTGITRAFVGKADEVHNQGEVWCVALWEARAQLIHKYGGAIGNQLMLQLVTDGMNLTPPNPTFLQARDGILQADRVNNGGTNLHELWLAFAKRGMGVSATVPTSASLLTGVHESFDVPDAMLVTPFTGFVWAGIAGKNISPTNLFYTIINSSSNVLNWVASNTSSWLRLSQTNGALPPGASTNLTVFLDSSLTNLPTGVYFDSVQFSNVNSGVSSTRSFELSEVAVAPMPFNENFESGSLAPYWLSSGTATFRNVVTSQNGPHGGVFHFTMDSSVADSYAINELTLAVNLNGYTNVVLNYWARDFGDEEDGPFPAFFNHADVDSVDISVDGLNWFEVQPLITFTATYRRSSVDLNSIIQEHGLSYTATFRIRFNHYDNSPISSDGIAVDDISIIGKTVGGLDHFEFSAIAPTQTVNVPFLAKINVKDAFQNTLTNFSGSVNFSAVTGPTFDLMEDFEDGDFNGWTVGSGGYTVNVTNGLAAVGSKSISLLGGNTNRYNGVSHSLPNVLPEQINFRVRAASTTNYCGYFSTGDSASDSRQAVFFYMKPTGFMGLVEDIDGEHLVPYNANQWYKISLVLDWSQRLVDFYVDGVLIERFIPFRGQTIASVNTVYLYNYYFTQVWFDQIEILSDKPPQTASMLPNAGVFSNGVWIGNVRIQQEANSVNLRADDGSGHFGSSKLFTVFPFVDDDADGIPNDWESAHGQNPNEASDALLDPDHDGANNLQEYLAGTDPNLAGSVLRILSSNRGTNGFQVTFSAAAGKLYRVSKADVLPSITWATVLDSMEGTGQPITIQDSAPSTNSTQFYRIELLQ
jgi:hypothetical protein